MTDETTNEEAEVTTPEATVEEKKPQEQTDKEYNFAQVRKQLKERDDYIRNLQTEMESLKSEFQKSRSPAQEEPDLDDDDFLTKKHMMKYAEQIADKKYEEKMKAYEQQNFKQRAKQTYPDFDSVVTTENLQRLEEEMPEIAAVISDTKDNYKMATGAYKAIKSLLKATSPQKEIEDSKKALEKNKKEPLAAAAVDRRPIAQAARLTDKDYQELWQEMQHYASKA